MQDVQESSIFDLKKPFKFFMSKELTSRTCGIPHVDSMELLNKKQVPVPTNQLFAKIQREEFANERREKMT
jgi:hypothetical protein